MRIIADVLLVMVLYAYALWMIVLVSRIHGRKR